MENKEELEKQERESLKERAHRMGLQHAKNISLDALRDLVNSKLNVKLAEKEVSANAYKEAMKLVRVRLICLNPNKKSWNAEYFIAGNSFVPYVARVVPYNKETHVENILYKSMLGRKIAFISYEKNADGVDYPVRKMRAEYQIELLSDLTDEELEKLRIDQTKRMAAE